MRRRPIRIHFQDRGQACTWWDLAPADNQPQRSHWRVVACQDESWLWRDSIVTRKSIAIGRAPVLIGDVTQVAVPTAIPVVKIERRPNSPRTVAAPPLVSNAITDARAKARQEAI